jgi:hypothetical protein
MSLSNEIMDMIKDILNSDLRPLEKLVLTIEWFLREQKPYELYENKLVDLQREVDAFVKEQVPSSLRRTAFKEAAEIFKIKDGDKISSLLIALSYYSYMDDEFVYDDNTRKELLSKLPELGFSSSEIQHLNDRWIRIIGSSEELFNRIFRKQPVETR